MPVVIVDLEKLMKANPEWPESWAIGYMRGMSDVFNRQGRDFDLFTMVGGSSVSKDDYLKGCGYRAAYKFYTGT